MITFKEYLQESRLATFATAAAIASSAMAAPPKPEALDMLVGFTKQKEGFRPVAEPDKDATGNPVVVGYGTTHNYSDTGKPIAIGDKVTKERAEELLKASYAKMTPHMEKIPGWDDMSAGQQAGIMSFAYNVGPGFYGKKGFETITQKLKDKKWDEVPEALSLYNKAGGKVLKGLVTRRAAEAEMWKSGRIPSQQPQQPQQPQPAQTTTRFHTVASGDNLSRIAKKYGTTVNEIVKKNPQIKDPNLIKPGQKINY